MSSNASKTSIDDLAISGGDPAFATQLFVGRPAVRRKQRILERFGEVLDRGWLTNAGPNLQELESRLCHQLEVDHVICTANGTLALDLMLRASGIQGEVVVPSFTFVATAHSVLWQGCTPVFCDVDPESHNLDPAAVEACITENTQAILGVHLWGRPCAIDALQEIADRHGLVLLFDAAQGFGCEYQGKPLGGFGRAESFSFHATKSFWCGEGGAIATNDGEMAARIRLMKNFGFVGYDQVAELGTNAKMSELAATLGLENLEVFAENVQACVANHEAYLRGLAGLPGIRPIAFDSQHTNTHHYEVIEVDAAAAGLSRDQIAAILHAENVLVRRYFSPGCHAMEPYATQDPTTGAGLPVTEALVDSVLCMPTGPTVSAEDIEKVCGILRFALNEAGRLQERGIDCSWRLPPFGATGVADPRVES